MILSAQSKASLFAAAVFIAVAICSLCGFAQLQAAEPVRAFDSPEQAALYLELTKAHRCLKCQNQNLADSNAGLAEDLKQEIYDRVLAGKGQQEISDYLVARYGDFVLYKPPFKASTYALWLGPFILLAVALWYGIRLSRTSVATKVQADSDAVERARSALD